MPGRAMHIFLMGNVTCDIKLKIQIVNNKKRILPLQILPQLFSSPQRYHHYLWLPSRDVLYICTGMCFVCYLNRNGSMLYNFTSFFHSQVRLLYVCTYRAASFFFNCMVFHCMDITYLTIVPTEPLCMLVQGTPLARPCD